MVFYQGYKTSGSTADSVFSNHQKDDVGEYVSVYTCLEVE